MNRHIATRPLTALLGALLLFAVPAWADTTENDTAHFSNGESEIFIGLGVESKRKAYKGVDTENGAIPVFGYENAWVRVRGPSLDLKLPSYGPVSFAVRAKFGRDGYKPEDSQALEGMAERKDGIWLGAGMTWMAPFGALSAEWLTDASSYSKGQQLNVMASKSWQLDSFRVTPRIGMGWVSSKYVNYYYGVGASEATSSRVAYDGGATTRPQLGLMVNYELGQHHGLMLDLGASKLGSSIKNSPLVDRSTTSEVRAGYVYRF